MRVFQLLLAAGALAALPACNLLAVTGGESGSAGANESASKGDEPEEKGEERAPRNSEEEPTRNETGREEGRRETAAAAEGEWILGRWGDAGCQTVLEFQGDGTFLINGSQGQWSLDGDTLIMSGSGGEQSYTVQRDGDGINIEDGAGNVQQLGRC